MKLAAVGSNCIDYYVNLDGGRPYPGGGPVNMAVYAVRLGGEASYTGPVGTDAYGDLMLRAAAAKGVDVSRMRKVPGRTAVTQVELRDGERVFCGYDEGVLDGYVLSEEDFAFLCTHDVVVCDTWGRVQKQFRELRARGIATAFDCSTRPGSPVSQEVMPYTDYLFFSAKGDGEDLRQQMRAYHARGPKMVIAMLGEAGSLCWDGERFHQFGVVPCPQVVDTLGAGDSYIAGFLTGLWEGRTIEGAMERGAACATETLGYFGAW